MALNSIDLNCNISQTLNVLKLSKELTPPNHLFCFAQPSFKSVCTTKPRLGEQRSDDTTIRHVPKIPANKHLNPPLREKSWYLVNRTLSTVAAISISHQGWASLPGRKRSSTRADRDYLYILYICNSSRNTETQLCLSIEDVV